MHPSSASSTRRTQRGIHSHWEYEDLILLLRTHWGDLFLPTAAERQRFFRFKKNRQCFRGGLSLEQESGVHRFFSVVNVHVAEAF
ncbi:hypothetical protein J4Q44_G00089370 [Coregonus suidteri]|uniref:Uncharacterized protein n=1 Tax=Coregonus suidteri TaxID=861788 RepID=A0AAN8LWB2_9TELE